jgi:hypothetical protein
VTEIDAHDRELLPRRAVVLRDVERERELLPLFDPEPLPLFDPELLPLGEPDPLLLPERELPLRDRDELLPPLRELVSLRLRDRDEAWLRALREPRLDDVRCFLASLSSTVPLRRPSSTPGGASPMLSADGEGEPSSPPSPRLLTSVWMPLTARGASAARPAPAATPLTPDRGPRELLCTFEATVLATSRAACPNVVPIASPRSLDIFPP